MHKTLKSMFQEDFFVSKFLATLICFLAVCLLLLGGMLLFIATDSWFLPTKQGTAKVVDRRYERPWVQTVVHSTGKSTWTQIIAHPAKWYLVMQIDGKKDKVHVDKTDYENVPDGKMVIVRYRLGRMSDSLYITDTALK